MTPVQKWRIAGAIITTTLEAFVLAEILWYYLHDGEQTLHGAVHEWFAGIGGEVERQTRIAETLDMIRDLPETE